MKTYEQIININRIDIAMSLVQEQEEEGRERAKEKRREKSDWKGWECMHGWEEKAIKKISEKDKDLLNNYLVSITFYDIETENGMASFWRTIHSMPYSAIQSLCLCISACRLRLHSILGEYVNLTEFKEKMSIRCMLQS